VTFIPQDISDLGFPSSASDARGTYAPPLDRERRVLASTPGFGLRRCVPGREAVGFALDLLHHC
jgi:hypothetical protein